MVTLETKNLHVIAAAHGISPAEIATTSKLLPKYIDCIHARQQGFYTVIDDKKIVADIITFARGVKGKFHDIVVLGIGGSALGTICLEQSLTHLFKKSSPRLYVLDNIDPTLMREVQDIIHLRKTLFIVITKSGGTPETLAQYLYFRRLTDRAKLNAAKHFVFVTDPKVGLLRKIANEENIPTFGVPENVGGRFSVQTAVGLLPAALIGIDIKAILAGCRTMRDTFLSDDPHINLPFRLASIQYLLAKKGKNINVLMPYAQHLVRFADWYRQLLAESIGKARNNAGETVNVGITPINALGATDQHSQSQLYNEGPNDKLIMFLSVKKLDRTTPIPVPLGADNALAFLRGVDFNTLINTERVATAAALTKYERPNITIHIDAITPRSLGELFLFFESATAFLGEFFDINAFDQPGVELSKNLTKEYLLKR